MVEGVRALGLESCVTLGMLTAPQAGRLRDAGLDYYNHNLDTSPEHYGAIITTRTYQDRLDTLAHVRDAGIAVCCGGIVGMGEHASDRAGLIATRAGGAGAPPPTLGSTSNRTKPCRCGATTRTSRNGTSGASFACASSSWRAVITTSSSLPSFPARSLRP